MSMLFDRRSILNAGLAFLMTGASAARAQGTAAPPLPPDLPISFGGPFSLVDHSGKARSDRDFRGRFMLIYFGYTHCPDLCPTGLQSIATALDGLGGAAESIQPLFVTVDPARDTVELLRDYVDYFHPRLIGLTGSEQQIREISKAYRIHRLKVVTEDEDDYLVTHSTITYLMGPDGKFVTLFPHDTDSAFMAQTLLKYTTQQG